MNTRVYSPLAPTGSLAGRAGQLLLTALLGCFAVFYLWYGMPPGPLNDFSSFWVSGKAASEGLDPYAIYPETFRSQYYNVIHANLNPPASLLLFAPLSQLDPETAFVVLWWGGLLVYAGIVVATLRRQPGPNGMLMGAWALALPGLWDGLRLGQIYVLLFAGVALVWYLLEEERPMLAAVVIGCLAALKPNLLVWPALLFVAGYWRMALAAGVAFAVACVLPVLFFGFEVYPQWLALLASDIGERSGGFSSVTVVAIGTRAGSYLLGGLLAALVLLWAVSRIWRRDAPVQYVSTIAVGVAVLVSPVVWLHYLLLLLPALLRRRWNAGIVIGAATMAVPTAAAFWFYIELPLVWPDLEAVIKATVGSLYAWGALLLVVSLARAEVGQAKAG